MTDLALALVKIAGPLAGKAAAGGLQWATLNLQVAWRVRRACRRASLPVPSFWRLRRFLSRSDVAETLASGASARVSELTSTLADADLGPDWSLTSEQSTNLLAVLLSAYTQTLPTNRALEVQAKSITRHFDEGANRGTLAEFEAALKRVSSPRAAEARSLIVVWGSMGRVVHEISVSSDRSQLMREWASARPLWLRDAPSQVVLWLAAVAEDFGLTDESASLIGEALDAGASPAPFWRVREALMSSAVTPDAQRAALRGIAGAHPTADALLAFLDDNTSAAVRHLEEWEANGAAEREFQDFLLTQVYARAEDFDAAKRVAARALANGQTAPAQILAERLLERGSPRTSAQFFRELESSRDMALKVRDTLRGWDGPSRPAVVLAIKAAISLGDSEMAWRMTQLPPVGDATDYEAAAESIRGHALLLAAEDHPIDEAEALLAHNGGLGAALEARAILAERRADHDEACDLWAALDARYSDPSKRLGIAFQLAQHGRRSRALEELSSDFPDEVAEIGLLADLYGDVSGVLEQARGAAARSRGLTFGLLLYLQRNGELLQAARVAADGGARWNDAELSLRAARLYLEAESYEEATEAAQAAVRFARSGGDHEAVAHLTLIEALSGADKWQEAADAAKLAMSKHPKHSGVTWALVRCQVHLGDTGQAWRTYSDFGARPEPRNDQEAAVLISLLRESEGTEDAMNQILALHDEWRESRPVQLATAHALVFSAGEVSGELAERCTSRVAELLAELPDVFVPHTIDEDDVMRSLDKLVEGLPDTAEQDRQVSDGTLPYGMAAAVHRRSFAETLVSRQGPLFATTPLMFAREVEEARAARGNAVAIDTTAVVTLTYFDDGFGSQLMGFAGSLTSSLRQRRDAIHARDNLKSLSTMTIGRSSDGSAFVVDIGEEEAEARLTRANLAVARFDATRVVERAGPHRAPELAEVLGKFVWAESLDVACSSAETALWCDDRRVRELARLFGLPAFGTSALIEALHEDGLISKDVATHRQAQLINERFVGGEFVSEWAEAAADLDGWKPRGAASYLAWGSPHSDVEQQAAFLMGALRRNSTSAEELTAWVSAYAHWLATAGGEEHADHNMVILVRQVLREGWFTAVQLPYVLSGVRAVTTAKGLADPFESALRWHYAKLVEMSEPHVAAEFIRGLVSLADEEDRATATRVAFTS